MVKAPQPYNIRKKWKTTHDVVVMELAPVGGGEVFAFKPGQFCMFRILNPDGTLWRQEAYSMASSPTVRDHIELGFKVHGPFTQHMESLQVGERVDITGPHGMFTIPEEAKDIVLIAGGIGITPFMSMMRHLTATKSDTKITFKYCNKTEVDIAYRKEIQDLADENPNLTVMLMVEKAAPGWRGEVGFMTEAILHKYCRDFSNQWFFMCGPPPMMEAVTKQLQGCNVPKEHIRKEKF